MRCLKRLFSFSVVLFALQNSFAIADDQPNIILIMADDLGFETLQCNGGESYKTPNLDKLAARGMRFTQCYAQPLCTPTRVQIMTGISNKRNYLRFGYMDPTSFTFGNLFESQGYRTAIAGKWQLGNAPGLPQKFGFEESYLWQQTRRPPRYANPGLEINGKEMDFNNGEYGPEIVNNYACDFIRNNQEKRFFLYYPMILTHSPYQPTPDAADWEPTAIGEKVNQKARHFGDMVTYMDKMIGRVAATVESAGVSNNTLILFLGDNGTGRGVKSVLNGQTVIGAKGETNRFGMHVPLIACWPDKISANSECGDLVDTTDFLPTLAEAASISLPTVRQIDGKSFLPQLLGQREPRRDWIYSWYSPRQNNEKISEFAFNQIGKLYSDGKFYDLIQDPKELSPIPKSELTAEQKQTYRTLENALGEYAELTPKKSGR